MIWLLFFFAFVVAAIVRGNRKLRRPASGLTYSISISSGQQRPLTPPKKMGQNTWVVNPDTGFPLTLVSQSPDAITRLMEIIQSQKLFGYQKFDPIAELLITTSLRCSEIEDYIDKYRPRYWSLITEMQDESTEWKDSSENDREDLMTEYRQKALTAMDIVPACDLEILLETKSNEIAMDSDLVKQYGFDLLQLYLKHAGKPNKVYAIKADHHYRKSFEKLTDIGLAVRGTDISPSSIFETLTLGKMNELLADVVEKKFTRKAKAIEYASNVPNLKERLQKFLALRELFQLKPLPSQFSHIDLTKLSSAFQFADQVARLLCGTYEAGISNTQNNGSLQYGAKSWKIYSYDQRCPCCVAATAKSYKSLPKLPHHIGCSCRAQVEEFAAA